MKTLMTNLAWLAAGFLIGSEFEAVISQRVGVVILLIVFCIAVWNCLKEVSE